jgi:peptidoglycan/xylan/chitin deacetylase (PgdA/CDA1 family)
MDSMNRSYRWRPAPAIRLSMMLHVAGVLLWAAHPASWPWVISVLVGNHLILSVAVLWPRGRLLGPNVIRLPAAAVRRGEISLTFDDGPDPETTPRVLEVLDRYRAKASFFCVGERAAASPDIVREIARRGHSIENHSHRHPLAFAFYGISRLTREVQSAQQVISGITGKPPIFFRAPLGFRSPLLDPVLAKCGLDYVSWTRRSFDAISRDPRLVLQRLIRGLAAGDVLLLHDGAGTRTEDGEPVVLAVLPTLLDAIAARGLKSVSLLDAFGDGSPA